MAKKCFLAASEAVDQTIDNITWLADDAVPGLGAAADNLPLPKDIPFLAGLYVGGASLERARISSTYLTRNLWLPDFYPVDTAVTPGDDPIYHDLRGNPLKLIDPQTAAQDNVNLQIENDGAASNTDAAGLAVFSDGPIAPISLAGYWPIRYTGTVTSVADAWSSAFTPTLSQTIPIGTYSCAGVVMDGADLKFWQTRGLDRRLNEFNSNYPVGGLCGNADNQRLPVGLRPGDMGELFRFRSDQLPQFRVVADTAQAQAPSGILWIRRIGA